MAERIHLVPPYTRKLAEVPFRLDHPYWVEDPEFEVAFHVRESQVEPPGRTHAERRRLVADTWAALQDRALAGSTSPEPGLDRMLRLLGAN